MGLGTGVLCAPLNVQNLFSINNLLLFLQRKPPMTRLLRLALASLWCTTTFATAAPLPLSAVPDPLKSWVPWVMQDHALFACPPAYNDGDARSCVWPLQLALDTTAQGASFRMEVQVVGALHWVALPGEIGQWPQEVKLSGQAVAVVLRDGRPTVQLPAGKHTLTGRFAQGQALESVLLPIDTGTLELSILGTSAQRTPDTDGRLWLQPQGDSSAPSQDALTVRTVRLIDDGIPLRITTRFDISVAGKAREIKLPAALLHKGFVPETLSSTLPARLQENGELRVQARPGNWSVEIRSHLMQAAKELSLPESNPEEIWSYLAHTDLRMLSLEGLVSVDPKQLPLPEAWRAYPAYQVKPGQTLKLLESRRGNPEPGADTLGLTRDIWLDFDGGGYTLRDHISGTVSRSWRLEMQPGVQLGRASAQGSDQPITRRSNSTGDGIALRRGNLDLSADSRIDGASRTLPATAWQLDFNSAAAQLNLPPGWMLLHASGVDKAEQSWVARWTLWDFFFVLLCTLAAARLLGRWHATAIALALVVSWHLPGSPHVLWLALLGSLALAKVLHPGKLQRLAVSGSRICVGMVALVLLPYAVQQIRLSIYPSLERPYELVSESSEYAPGASIGRSRMAPVAAAAPAAIAQMADVDMVTSKDAVPRQQLSKSQAINKYKQDNINQIDPNAKVQTGPGLPAWQWSSHALVWQGPVLQNQQLHLFLLPPLGTLALRLGSLALLLLALWLVAKAVPRWSCVQPIAKAPVALAGMLLFALLGAPDAALASRPSAPLAPLAPAAPPVPAPQTPDDSPTKAILEELATKLTSAPECLPQCAEISRLWVQAKGERVQLRLEVHAVVDTQVPLPGQGTNWRPVQVLVDGKPAVVRRDQSGVLWLFARAGVSQVVLTADVGDSSTVEIALPMPAQHVGSQLEGWTLSGLDARNLTSGALSLSRTAKVASTTDSGTQADALPPFVQIERTLHLGLRWSIDTRITRLTPSRAPVRVKIRLLPSEAVNDNVVRVEDGHALLQLGAQDEATFISSLNELAELSWNAATEPQQIEIWHLDPGPQWHVSWSGIAPIQYQQDGQLMPQWQPWPGERVDLQISKPAGVTGQTITLDRMSLVSTPGLRATDVNATGTVRTSQGGNHKVQLPENTEFLSLQLDGKTQPIRPQGRELLIPLSPGAHTLSLQWREPRGMRWHFTTTEFGFNAAGVNARTEIKIPTDRVVLAAGGPVVGPAVLFWGTLLAMAAVAVALGRSHFTPLRALGWFLLGLGLIQTSVVAALVATGWFFAIAARQRFESSMPTRRWVFNAVQISLVLWTLLVAAILFDAVRVGLLGYPDMLIAGNGSHAGLLRWYQDRFALTSQTAWVISMPVLLYRLLMLAWALWLAAALLQWVKWAWQCFGSGAGGAWHHARATE
jgi:hypothetical protein